VAGHAAHLESVTLSGLYVWTFSDQTMPHAITMSSTIKLLLLFAASIPFAFAFLPSHNPTFEAQGQVAIGHNDLFVPDPDNPVPYKEPFKWDEKNYYEKHFNGSGHGYYRRSSCPGVNTLANRGFINRSGRNISYDEIAQAARVVWNFGDDNASHFSNPL
jgi:hypothetical protein